jgi:phosphotransferase system enzyme I (PtsI)
MGLERVKLIGSSVCPGRVFSKSHLIAAVPAFDLDGKNPKLNRDEARGRVEKAIANIITLLDQSGKRCKDRRDMADLLDVQKAMISDSVFLEDVYKNISGGYEPVPALLRAARVQEDMLRGLDDGFMEMRADDMHDVSVRAACLIAGVPYPDLSILPDGGVILVGCDILPSMLLNADIERCKGIVIEKGTRTAHVSVLALSLEIPMVTGCPGAGSIPDNCPLYLDGEAGFVEYGFSPAQNHEYEAKVGEYKVLQAELLPFAGREAKSAEGRRIDLHANIIDPAVLGKVLDYGMDGVGLFRTEFLYMNRKRPPSEEEQFTVYKMALEKLAGKPVTIRTMDIGGDKGAECLNLPKEDNPFMGRRAIRICLSQPELMITQLRAILRAGVFGNARVMFPMIAAVGELEAVLSMLKTAKNELEAENVPFASNIPAGIMVEIPSAVITLDTMVEKLDFVSIGSNDLIQYTFAADRLNPAVSYLYNALAPAVLRLIKHTIDVTDAAGIECSLCGEMAGDALGMAALAALGLKKFSVSPSLALAAKRRLSLLHIDALGETEKRILAAKDAEETEQILKTALGGNYC